jgi:hypothetical protein
MIQKPKTKAIKAGLLSTLLFEIGLAVKLNKISTAEAMRYLPLNNIKDLADKIDKSAETQWQWGDTVITPGERLRAALEMHEVSQVELAKKLNVTPQKINDLISGRLTLTVKWAQRISEVLKVNYKVFL